MHDVYARQGFGAEFPVDPPFGLLVVDFVNAFADPAVFGSEQIQAAIENSIPLLQTARDRGWPIAFSRVVYADDGADSNVFSQKVPGLLRLTEEAPGSAVVDVLSPAPGELVVRRRCRRRSTPPTLPRGSRNAA